MCSKRTTLIRMEISPDYYRSVSMLHCIHSGAFWMTNINSPIFSANKLIWVHHFKRSFSNLLVSTLLAHLWISIGFSYFSDWMRVFCGDPSSRSRRHVLWCPVHGSCSMENSSHVSQAFLFGWMTGLLRINVLSHWLVFLRASNIGKLHVFLPSSSSLLCNQQLILEFSTCWR